MDIRYIGHATLNIVTPQRNILTDPWLTQRLDRCWTHLPPIDENQNFNEIDTVLLTHHHCEHLHVPSLIKLNREVEIYFPETQYPLTYSGSGMGFKSIAWTLRKLGFKKLFPLKKFTTLNIGDIRLTTFPSNVSFPELSLLLSHNERTIMFCGDCILHEQTQVYLKENPIKIDIGFIPSHSIAPPEPFMLRTTPEDYRHYVEKAKDNFLTYVNTIKPTIVVPTAFGMKVSTPTDNEDLSWLNRVMYPLTPYQAAELLKEDGAYRVQVMGPGDQVYLGNDISFSGSWCSSDTAAQELYQSVTLDESFRVPTYNPSQFRRSTSLEEERDLINAFLLRLVGSDYWHNVLEFPKIICLQLSGGDINTIYQFLPETYESYSIIDSIPENADFTIMHTDTFKQLMESKLLLSSSYGLWVSNNNMLSSVFHHPSYYINYTNSWLAENIE